VTFTRLINTIHHGQLSTRQRELLIALPLHLAACSNAMAYCPEMTNVQAVYRELLTDAGRPLLMR
jgi:hypothetical protein